MTDLLFNWLPLAGLVGTCLFGLILVILGLRGLSKARKLRNSGATMMAQVTEKTVKVTRLREPLSSGRDRRHSRTYYLSFAFRVGGKEYSGAQVAPSDLWRAVEKGSEVEIDYYTADPSVNQLKASALGVSGIGGLIQTGAGLALSLAAIWIIAVSALDAYRGPAPLEPGANWVESDGVIRWVRVPEDPFMRMLAPNARRIYVEIGEMEPDKLYSERETTVYPHQVDGIPLRPGTKLRAYIDPENEVFSILEIESIMR